MYDVYLKACRGLLCPDDIEALAGGLDIVGESHGDPSAGRVFYDATVRPDGDLALVVGSKSMGLTLDGDLYAIAIRSVLQALMGMNVDVVTALAAANRFLLRSRPDGYCFMSLFVAVLEPQSRSFIYAGAGSQPALLRRDSGVLQSLGPNGIVIGVSPDFTWQVSAPIHLERGDALLAYSESMYDDWGGDEGGAGNIEASFDHHAAGDKSAGAILAGLFADFDAYRPEEYVEEFVAMVIKAPA